MRRWLPWCVWGAFLIVWTYELLTPDPVPIGKELLPEDTFTLAKAVHLSAYALLAVLLGWLPVRPHWRWALLAALAVHANLSEYLQTFVEGRTGSLRDVALDHLGLAIGVAVSWGWWPARWAPRPPAGE